MNSSSIFELPNKLTGAGTEINASMATAAGGGGGGDPMVVPPGVMNDVITSIQQTKNSLLGHIPTRDMGMQSDNITTDAGTRANYIPPPPPPPPAQKRRGRRRSVRFDDEYSDDDEDDYNPPRARRRNGAGAGAGASAAANKESFLGGFVRRLQGDSALFAASVSCLLYFVFDVPLFRALLFRLLPFIFTPDGNMSMAGIATKAALFGAVVYAFLLIANI